MTSPLALINGISAPCAKCSEPGHFGTRHTIKEVGARAILRCLSCGGGYAISTSGLPRKAPPELVIQSIINLIVNRQADILPANARTPDEESP